jgi:ferredoxin--NADP+ reductase
MLGLSLGGRSVMRAYSIASANYEDHLEYLSIVMPDGKLTPSLSAIKPGDEVIIGGKPTGTLLISDLKPGRALYLLATGTGLAPFLSVIRDPATYEQFDKVVLVHCVRYSADLAYREYICNDLLDHDLVGEAVRERFLYYATVTREPFPQQRRITALIEAGDWPHHIGLQPMDPSCDRLMICGNPHMLADTRTLLDLRGFKVSAGFGLPGDYVYERAFAEAVS